MKSSKRMYAMLLAIAACAPVESRQQAAAPNAITVRTRDFAFYDMPDTIPAGATTIRLINDGPDIHHVWLVRLEEGKAAEDLLAALNAAHSMPAWAVDVGGPNAGVPGEATLATVNLEAGNYVVICVIPSADGVLHVMKGMWRALTVVPAAQPKPLPQADAVLTLNDYTFSFDQPVQAGRQTIRVENAAQQPHEVVLIQLEPGRTVHEMLAWIEKRQGPPPGKLIGGVTGLARGEVNLITHDFKPGNYGLICFVPDMKDGRPHFLHGMVTEFTIEA